MKVEESREIKMRKEDSEMVPLEKRKYKERAKRESGKVEMRK